MILCDWTATMPLPTKETAEQEQRIRVAFGYEIEPELIEVPDGYIVRFRKPVKEE